MSDQSYEIRCPACKSVVPTDAARCPNCAAAAAEARAADVNASAASSPALATATAPAVTDSAPPVVYLTGASAPEGASTLKLKDYHRMVRTNYGRVEQRGPARTFGNPLVPALLILVLGLIVGAAVVFGWL